MAQLSDIYGGVYHQNFWGVEVDASAVSSAIEGDDHFFC